MFTFIPLLYQLYQAYQSTTLVNYQTNPAGQILSAQNTPTPTPTITPTPQPQHIGGIGQITNIALIGDSMIETLTPETPDLKKSLSVYFPSQIFYIKNYGFPAKTIDYAYSKINEIIDQQPDIIILESFAYNNYGNTQEGINKQWLNLGAITTKIKKELPNTKIIITTTIAPNSVEFAKGSGTEFTGLEKIEKAKTIKLYLQNAINFANSQNFYLANSYNLSLDSNKEGFKELINTNDNIHPSPLGQRLFCDSIAKTIFDNKIIKDLKQ
jgi:lysophospholipase L1-like esterase